MAKTTAASLTPLNFEITVNGVEGTEMMIREMEERAINPGPLLRSIAVKDWLEESAERRMEHYPFKPVSASWRAAKARRGFSPKTMHATDALARALERTTRDVRLDAHATTLTWGIKPTSDLWMRTHIQATRGRRAVVIDASAQTNIVIGIAKYIAYGQIRRAAGGLIAAGATAIPGVPPPP